MRLSLLNNNNGENQYVVNSQQSMINAYLANMHQTTNNVFRTPTNSTTPTSNDRTSLTNVNPIHHIRPQLNAIPMGIV